MSEHEHILSAFDRDLEEIQEEIMKMGGKVELSIVEAVEALVHRDVELAARVRAADRAIDAMEECINQNAAQVIARQAPTASDLRAVLAVFRISANLERIADYSKNAAKRCRALANLRPVDASAASLRRMAREVEAMLSDALDAYIEGDVERAEDVRLRDSDVDQMYNAVFRELLTHMMEDPRNITAAMHLHFIAKNIERMGDHVTSIAEQVIYIVTGKLPDEDRPKGDRTSYVGAPNGGG